MAETQTFSRSELVRIAGVDDDAVAFWLRSKLLLPEDRGARKHRRFTRLEVKFAALLRELRNIGLNVSAMSGLIGQLRTGLVHYREALAFVGDEGLCIEAIFEARSPGGMWDETTWARRDVNETAMRNAMELAKRLDPLDTFPMMAACDFDGPENRQGIIAASRLPSGQWAWIAAPSESRLPCVIAISIDLQRLFAMEWPERGGAGEQ